MPKIKICGLTRPTDIEAINKLKPEYMGFVFAKSRRQVTPTQAADLRKNLSPEITPVGVFVNAAIKEIIFCLENGIIDIVQLHGTEDFDYINKLKQQTDKPIIKAIGVSSKNDITEWINLEENPADFLLLDNAKGGTGQSFDWNILKGLTNLPPFFLAGGLSPSNIAEAIATTKTTNNIFHAVDVSSGVESNGLKDPQKIEDFIWRARHGK
jgi:phosphoribosylanthranilate isomerase